MIEEKKLLILAIEFRVRTSIEGCRKNLFPSGTISDLETILLTSMIFMALCVGWGEAINFSCASPPFQYACLCFWNSG